MNKALEHHLTSNEAKYARVIVYKARRSAPQKAPLRQVLGLIRMAVKVFQEQTLQLIFHLHKQPLFVTVKPFNESPWVSDIDSTSLSLS